MYIYTYLYIYMNIWIYTYFYIYIYVWMYTSIYMYIYVYIYTYMFMYIFTSTLKVTLLEHCLRPSEVFAEVSPKLLLCVITLEPRVEWYNCLWTLNTSLPRNRLTILRSETTLVGQSRCDQALSCARVLCSVPTILPVDLKCRRRCVLRCPPVSPHRAAEVFSGRFWTRIGWDVLLMVKDPCPGTS